MYVDSASPQRLPLFATMTIPSLVLSTESLDFGTCLVGQRRELQLTLSNPTASISFWSVSLGRSYPHLSYLLSVAGVDGGLCLFGNCFYVVLPFVCFFKGSKI